MEIHSFRSHILRRSRISKTPVEAVVCIFSQTGFRLPPCVESRAVNETALIDGDLMGEKLALDEVFGDRAWHTGTPQ